MLTDFFALLFAIGMGIVVAGIFCSVEESKEQRRERRRVEKWVAERVKNKPETF